ncbi:TonB-dependent receptor [Altererythrobacter sp. FM1]|uniref:TonB-dependent receptor n=1 Tax=Tsuneonella flava TaxID=2055955 RepID=UPI000C80D52A|nr:TonB-dependent receptor [Tsuneonella flava]ROT97358.1 TonB-dependent receptor [Altererythrobacter sp. FM1]
MKAKLVLLCGASALTFLSQPVLAQASSDSQSSEAVAEESGEAVGGDIIVTAQRREQRLQDVPISISAVNSSTLENTGVTGTSQLQSVVPNLVVVKSVGAAAPFLRGIGSSSADIAAESSVAIYVDGVYQPSVYANVFEFNGLERIEVLKGPQGTLFGRNATGGVVQVVTKAPSFSPEMNFAVSYGNYETVSAAGYVSAGLSDNVAANLAVQYQNQNEGWGRNVTLGTDDYYARDFNARAKLLFTPGDATEITLAGNYGKFTHHNIGLQNPPGAGQGFLGRYQTAGNDDAFVDGEGYGGSLTATHDFGSFQIRSITAYSKFDATQTIDQDASPLHVVRGDFVIDTRMVSEEFHIMAPSDAKFQWLAGVFYYNYDAAINPTKITGLAFSPLPGVSLFGVDETRSISGFAQGTYPLTDKLSVTAGIRYTRDEVTYTGSQNISDSPVALDPEQTKKLVTEKPTWRVSLDYKFSPEVLGYISYNRGTKSGGFSLGTAPSFNTGFLPEQLDAYEAGLKTELFDRKLIFNTSAFYYDFENIQFQRVVAGVVQTVNGPSAKLYGAEVELTGRVTPELTLRANGGYLHTEIGDFPGAPNTNRLPNGLNDNGDPTYNAKGNRLPNAPEFSGNVGFEYRYPINNGAIRLSSNLLYAGKAFNELDNRLFVDEHVVLSASLGWEGDDGLRLSVWANNLTDSYYYSFQAGVAGGSDIAQPAPPRTYGVTLGYSF